MFFHARLFFYSLSFFLVLEVICGEAVSDFLVSLIFNKPILMAAIIVFFLFFVFIFTLKTGKKISMTIIPVLLAFSSWGLLSLIDTSKEKGIFAFLASTVYYACMLGIHRLKLYEKDQIARGLIASSAVATLFLFYSVSYGVYMNFAIPLSILMILFFVMTTLVSYQYFQLIQNDNRIVWIYSAVIGIAITEISWIVNFWPFGYLTTGVIMLIFYYVLWDLVQSHFLEDLSKKKVVVNMALFGFLIVMVLTSSRWMPIV